MIKSVILKGRKAMKRSNKIIFLALLGIMLTGVCFSHNTYAETFDGEYSIKYLLSNYNVVTLGKDTATSLPLRSNRVYGNTIRPLISYDKGDLRNYTDIAGAVLVNGNYYSTNNSTFGTNAGDVKSYIKGTKGNNVSTSSTLVTDSNYIDFEKLHKNVLNESRQLIDRPQKHINSEKLEVEEPGSYIIDNAPLEYYNNETSKGGSTPILIKNYNPDDVYIFNYYNEYTYFNFPIVQIMEPGSSTSEPLISLVGNGNYTGNVIFNFPYAKFINLGFPRNTSDVPIEQHVLAGNIVAPNACVYMELTTVTNNSTNTHYVGNIIANTIINGNNGANGTPYSNYIYNNLIYNTNYKLSKNIIDLDSAYYYKEAKDYDDDIYSRDYSIKDLLENYNLVTLGHKQIDSKSKLAGKAPGTAKLFHITGQALIAGNIESKIYPGEKDDYLPTLTKFDRTAFDLESNKVTESFIQGVASIQTSYFGPQTLSFVVPTTTIQPFDSMAYDNLNFYGRKNSLFIKQNAINTTGGQRNANNITGFIESDKSYINFDRLYNNIVAEQKKIEKGTELKPDSNGILHITIGGCYNIKNIASVREIIFDNFEDNKNKLTIITIDDSGDINFPLLSKSGNGYKGIVTNDYYGKEKATHFYERDTFLSRDSYHGNIVWNLPNATYIKLKEDAPFAGHLVAPNADVETPELHFAGSFIVNSIYGEGNTEAHFYPLIVNEECACEEYHQMSDAQKRRFYDYRLSKSLGGEGSTVQMAVMGNQTAYAEEKDHFELALRLCNGINDASTSGNPGTRDAIIMSVIAAAVSSIVIAFVVRQNAIKR